MSSLEMSVEASAPPTRVGSVNAQGAYVTVKQYNDEMWNEYRRVKGDLRNMTREQRLADMVKFLMGQNPALYKAQHKSRRLLIRHCLKELPLMYFINKKETPPLAHYAALAALMRGKSRRWGGRLRRKASSYRRWKGSRYFPKSWQRTAYRARWSARYKGYRRKSYARYSIHGRRGY